MPNSFSEVKYIIVIPIKSKLKYYVSESANKVIDKKYIYTIVKNNSNKIVILRKKFKLGAIERFEESQILEPSENEDFQVNSWNLTEISKLRDEAADFDLAHLNEKDSNNVFETLMKNSHFFSRRHKTLDFTDDVRFWKKSN